MKNCFLTLLLLLILSSCNFADCFNADDINTQTITEDVPLKPKNFKADDNTTLWYSSDFKIDNNEITLNIKSFGANLCTVDPVIFDKITVIHEMEFFDGDKILFNLEDEFTEKIDDYACDGLNPNFYTANPQKCQLGEKDENGNKIINELKGSSYGAKFTKSINSNNVVFNYADENKISKFFSNAKDAPLFSTENATINQEIQNGNFDYLDQGLKITPNKNEYICNNLDNVKIQPIIKKISVETLADLCGVLCRGNAINGQTPIESGCFYSSLLYKNQKYTGEDEMQQYLTLLKGLDVKVNNISILSNNIYGISDALILGYPYSIPSESKKSYESDNLLKVANNLLNMKNKVSYSLSQSLKGAYKFSAKRSCDTATEKSLYYYIGNSIPDLKPGESGTTNIPFSVSQNSKYLISDNAKGNVYFGIKDNGDGYTNNSGILKITAKVPIKTPDIFSWIVRGLRDTILKIFYGSDFGYDENGRPLINQDQVGGAVGLIFNAVINSVLLTIVKAMIVLYIAIFGISVLIGLVKTPHIDFLIIVLKISLVLTMFSSTGWRFLSENLFYWFIYGTSDLITAFSGDFSGGVDFKFIDESLGRFYKYQTWLQILSLLLAGPVGWLVMFIIIFGLVAFFSAMFKAIVTYIISMTLIALLLSISPIFISLIFFKKTKAIFDAWIKNLAQITIQPVFIMSTIAFLAQVMNAIMYGLFSYGVCTGCIINLKISNLDPMCIFSFILPYGFNFANPVGEHMRNTYNGYSFLGIPISIANVIAFAILAHAIEKFTEQASTMVTSIFGAFGADISEPAEKVTQSAKSVVGKDDLSMQNKAHQQHQKKRNKVD